MLMLLAAVRQLFFSVMVPWRNTRQQNHVFDSIHYHHGKCFAVFALGAFGFRKQTVGEGLLLYGASLKAVKRFYQLFPLC